MKNLILFFLENRKFTFIGMVFLLILGVMGLMKLNSESYPAVNFASATVTTFYQGAGPEEIEAEITKPLEDEIRTVRGLKDVRSVSQSGLSKISIRVDMDRYNVDEVMDDLQKAVQRVSDLPAGIKEEPKFEEINSEEFPAIELALMGSNQGRMRDQLADNLKDVLEDNKKVLGVRLAGYREREFSVRLDKTAMQQNYVGVAEVVRTLKARNRNFPAGNLEQTDERLLIKLDGKVETIPSLKETYIRSNFTGQSVQLKDIALVEDAMEEAKVLSRINGQEATLLTVTKKAGEDTIQLVHDIEVQLKKFSLPEGYSTSVYNNESEKVKNRMEVLTSNAVTGLVLVVFFLLLFLPGKIGIMASLSLPLAIMGTIGLMPSIMNMNLNAITILALVIALGMLVDNSVVISENYTRLLQQGLSPKEAAFKSAYQFWLPISCTAFTTIAAFLPMLVTKGVMGQFIKYIPIVVTLSLLLSLVESFFLLPTRLSWVKAKQKEGTVEVKTDWFHKVTVKFEKLMDLLVKRRYLVMLTFGGIIFGSLFMLVKVNKFILFPAEQTEIYVSRFEAPKGTPVEQTDKLSQNLSQKIKDILSNDVAHLVSRAGVIQAGPTDPKSKDGEHVGMLLIYMTREASFKLKYTDVLTNLRKIHIPGLDKLNFEAQVNGPPVGNPVTATFRSNNSQQLVESTQAVVDFLSQQKGILNPETDDVIGEDEIFVQPHYSKIARLGLDISTIGETIQSALEGSVITKLNLNNKRIELKVKMQDKDRNALKDLEEVAILDRQGNLIPLKELVDLKKRAGTPIVKRFDFQRAKTITADIDESLTTSVEANQKLAEYFKKLRSKYPEVSLIFGGEQENTKESMASLQEAMVLALIAIFGILVFLFKSYLRPLVIMSTIPLGLLGFSIALQSMY